MLNIIYSLEPFIEDCYRETGVREYARIIKITAPTASKKLKEFEAEGMLKKRLDRGYLLFRANRESEILNDISRIYWRQKLQKLIGYLNLKFHSPTIILFGSLTKLETKKDSDIDMAVLTNINKKSDLTDYEKLYKREIQLFTFKSLKETSKELKNNILNGFIIQGELK